MNGGSGHGFLNGNRRFRHSKGRARPRPHEADLPLRVDPYAEPAGAITLQGFETIAS